MATHLLSHAQGDIRVTGLTERMFGTRDGYLAIVFPKTSLVPPTACFIVWSRQLTNHWDSACDEDT